MLSSSSRISRIATQNYGMTLSTNREVVDLSSVSDSAATASTDATSASASASSADSAAEDASSSASTGEE